MGAVKCRTFDLPTGNSEEPCRSERSRSSRFACSSFVKAPAAWGGFFCFGRYLPRAAQAEEKQAGCAGVDDAVGASAGLDPGVAEIFEIEKRFKATAEGVA